MSWAVFASPLLTQTKNMVIRVGDHSSIAAAIDLIVIFLLLVMVNTMTNGMVKKKKTSCIKIAIEAIILPHMICLSFLVIMNFLNKKKTKKHRTSIK